jgi:hypothetical protein
MDCEYPTISRNIFWHGVSIMKSRKPLLSTLAAGAFLFAGTLLAQNAPPPPQPPPSGQDVAPAPPPPPSGQDMPMPPAPPSPPSGQNMPPAPATSMPPAPSAQPAPAPASTSANGQGQAMSQSAQAQVVVRSVPPPAPTIGPAPPFEQLSGGKKSISADQAVAYPPLANDFIHADTNRDGHISKTEYSNWTKQL